MSTSIDANITRDEITALVKLLGVTAEQDNSSAEIDSTTVNGEHENPVSIQRAFRTCIDYQADDDFDPGMHPELFDPDYEFDDQHDDGHVIAINPIEEHDEEADREAARDIITYLTGRFGLSIGEAPAAHPRSHDV